MKNENEVSSSSKLCSQRPNYKARLLSGLVLLWQKKSRKSAWPFTEGGFIKNCMLKVCDAVCPDKRQLFSNVSLSRNTIAERIDQLSTNLKEQLVGKEKDFIAYSLVVDERTDTTDIAQLSILNRGVDSSLSITGELLALRLMHGTTTGQDLYQEL